MHIYTLHVGEGEGGGSQPSVSWRADRYLSKASLYSSSCYAGHPFVNYAIRQSPWCWAWRSLCMQCATQLHPYTSEWRVYVGVHIKHGTRLVLLGEEAKWKMDIYIYIYILYIVYYIHTHHPPPPPTRCMECVDMDIWRSMLFVSILTIETWNVSNIYIYIYIYT